MNYKKYKILELIFDTSKLDKYLEKNMEKDLTLLEKFILKKICSILKPFTKDSKKRIKFLGFMQNNGISAIPNRYWEPIPTIIDIDKATKKISLITNKLPTITSDLVLIYSKLSSPNFDRNFFESKYLYLCYENPMFPELDSFSYINFIEKYKPNNIIEIGSGFSAQIAYNTIKINNFNTTITSFEPFPNQILINLNSEESSINLIKKKIQDINEDEFIKFQNLKENDILFIDSTHVINIGGDLPFIFNKILPILNKGVIIHIHDIFYPYEYSRRLSYNSGRMYNEAYLISTLVNHGIYEYLYGSYDLLNRFDCSHIPYQYGISCWFKKI